MKERRREKGREEEEREEKRRKKKVKKSQERYGTLWNLYGTMILHGKVMGTSLSQI